MKKKGFIALSLVMMMSLSLPLISYAQQSSEQEEDASVEKHCPLTIKGQKLLVDDTQVHGMGSVGRIIDVNVIIVGTDHIEDSDLTLEYGNIRYKELNTDDGKLPEFEFEEIYRRGDQIQIGDNIEGCVWCIELFRLPDNMSSADELMGFKKYAIYDSGYQNKPLPVGWQKHKDRYWYHCGDGNFLKDEWKEIDGKFYYFNGLGYMFSNGWTTDGYYVDENGVWIPGYDEELREGATVEYYERIYDENGEWLTSVPHKVPVSKMSELFNVCNNLKENERLVSDIVFIIQRCRKYR